MQLIPTPWNYHGIIVAVDPQPIGGYRGSVGTISITHEQNKIFTDWTGEDLGHLAELTNHILYQFEKREVTNTLLYARQEGTAHFKLSLVPYPKCNWIEKIQGMIHVIFGSSPLNEAQMGHMTATFESFKTTIIPQPPQQRPVLNSHPDAFCRAEVIKKQEIATVVGCHILHDNRPRGATQDDPHLLIVPQGENGHVDGSGVPLEQRKSMLLVAQKTMQVLLSQNKFSTFLLLERNGTQLRGVPHQHMHVIGIQQFPSSFLEKVKVILRQAWVMIASPLSVGELKTRIEAFNPTALRQFNL